MINVKRQKIRKSIVFFSFLLFPFTIFYFSPYLIIVASKSGIIAGCTIVFIIQFVTSLFFGRAFCGWICPVSGLTECCSTISNKKAKLNKTRFIKYIIWVPWIVAIIFLFTQAKGIKKTDFLFMTNGGLPMLGLSGYIIYYAVVVLIVLLTLTKGKRQFCHTLCWMAPFMVLGSKIKKHLPFPSLIINSETSKCTGCNQCNKNCPMDIDIKNTIKCGEIESSECILCGQCVDGCKPGVLNYKIKRK